MNNVNEIIKGPILTEKSYQLMSASVYSFKVSPKTNRSETKKAVEYIFNVKVDKVNIFTVPKKEKKLGKSKGFTTKYKKALVKLKPGYTINLFDEESPQVDSFNQNSENNNETMAKIEQKKAELDVKNQEIAQKLAKKHEKASENLTTEKIEKTAENQDKGDAN
ncbi:50S ribosomal protein L23 [Mycoplasma flocculare]|uniref:50S ribosomal protein L23 n=1 Tax=Mesomycoplasma flocculare TaxID=2128 RepID=UPI00136C4A01|nr:50S ribosomal protein L23 [Mesomycoplasma flocculare]MXR13505.1 50S ribosomal protein L23 [Mesomycoplasma flocculare]